MMYVCQYLNVWWQSVSHSRQHLAKSGNFTSSFSLIEDPEQIDKRKASTGSILLNVELMSQGFEGWSSSPGLTGIYEEDTILLVSY